MARKSNVPSLFDLDDAPVAVAEDPAVVARREAYRARLAEKLKDPEFRKIEGFPIGTDEAILALSDPPYYTACPNPFLDEWLAEHATLYDAAADSYHREPFAADVSEGKNDPIYNAHSYHTKVPHKAIMRYILHYTQPGDVVYDGFCGTGMTGVAAQLCGDRLEIESLGYIVKGDAVWEKDPWEARNALEANRPNPHRHLLNPQPFSRLGSRKTVLSDLSPAASFIAHNYNSPVEASLLEREARTVLAEVESEYGWMYATLNDCTEEDVARWTKCVEACQTSAQLRAVVDEIPLRNRARISYTVWSDVFVCPSCGADIVYWDAAVDTSTGDVRSEFACASCGAFATKANAKKRTVSTWDADLRRSIETPKMMPVVVDSQSEHRRSSHPATAFDRALAAKIDALPAEHWYPAEPMLGSGARWGDTWRQGYHTGVTHCHQFYTRRNLLALAAVEAAISKRHRSVLGRLRFWRTAPDRYLSKMAKVGTAYFFRGGGGAVNAGLMGTLYIPSFSAECSVFNTLENRLPKLVRALAPIKSVSAIVGTQSAAAEIQRGEVVDYIFTDPPFGSNLMYAELNFLIEAWGRVITAQSAEAVESPSQAKTLAHYSSVMVGCFANYYKVLKPGRWMTVEFHNSANAVWNAIQGALESVGFIVADVRVLDKQQYGFNQVSATSATKQDLVISCYKPTAEFQSRFNATIGRPEGVRDFLEEHLSMLPVTPLTKSRELERLAERTQSILYDRMIAYHLVRGAQVPLSGSEFKRLLSDHFVQRDGMWFLPGQEVDYDLCKLRGVEVEQQVLFVSDERSAVTWLRSELNSKSHSLGELTPKFMQATKEWPAHEPRPELRELLRDWFIEVDGRWANPNPDDEKHVEALRKKSLLRLFATYATGKGKLKEFRREALIEAFRYCWNSGQEAVFVTVCQRIPDKLLRDDAQLSEAYDLAADRVASRPPPAQQEFEWE
jgi:hypothetical protein